MKNSRNVSFNRATPAFPPPAERFAIKRWSRLSGVFALLVSVTFLSAQTFPVATNPTFPELIGGIVFDGKAYLVGYMAGTNIVGQRISTNGEAIGVPFIVGTNAGWPPQAALVGARTNCLVAWSDITKTSGVTMFGRICVPNTGTVSPPFPLLNSAGSHGFQSVWDAASDGTNFLVLWVDSKDQVDEDYYSRFYGQFISVTGSPSGSEFVIIDGGTNVDATVAFGKTNYLIAWYRKSAYDQWDVYCRAISVNGTLGPTTKLNTTPNWDHNPIAIGSDGTNFLVVWNCTTNYGSPGELMLFGRLVSPTGTPLSPEMILDTDRCGFPAIAYDGHNYLVVWAVNAASTPNIKARFINPSSGPIGPIFTPLLPQGTNPPLWPYRGTIFDGSRFVITATFGRFIVDPEGGIVGMAGGDIYGRFFPRSTTPPYFTNVSLANGRFQGQLWLVPGVYYTLLVSTNLSSSQWLPVDTVSSTGTNLITLTDDQPPEGTLFVRARMGVHTQAHFEFYIMEFAYGGIFGAGYTPTPQYPVSLNNYSAAFGVHGDSDFPSTSGVLFTGPPGSGLTNTPAWQSYGGANWMSYQSPPVFSPAAAPGGTWTVSYKGSNVTFNIPDPQANSRLVLPLPTVNVNGDTVQSVTWVYKNPITGATLPAPPSYMSSIQVQIDGNLGGRIYNSPELNPNTTSHTLTTPVLWSQVSGLNMAYDDDLGNHYVIIFRKQ